MKFSNKICISPQNRWPRLLKGCVRPGAQRAPAHAHHTDGVWSAEAATASSQKRGRGSKSSPWWKTCDELYFCFQKRLKDAENLCLYKEDILKPLGVIIVVFMVAPQPYPQSTSWRGWGEVLGRRDGGRELWRELWATFHVQGANSRARYVPGASCWLASHSHFFLSDLVAGD